MNEQSRLVKRVQEENKAAEEARYKDSLKCEVLWDNSNTFTSSVTYIVDGYTYTSGNIVVNSAGSPPPVITSKGTSCSNTTISNGQTITYSYQPPLPFPIPAKV